MYSKKLYSPLRYPGGKARFAPFIADVIARNAIKGGEYLEPYAGGAGVALELLLENHVEAIHINDGDPAISAFWMAATRHTDELVELVRKTPISMDEWFRWRAVLTGQTTATPVERGFATLFLNRTNRSGILMAGVIGGKAQAGRYRLDARFKRDELVARLQRVGRHASRIHVYSEDGIAVLRRCHQFLPLRSLVYLDPPYYSKGQDLYRNIYVHDDHARVARLLQSDRFRRPWIVSYDSVPAIRKLYRAVHRFDYDLQYTAQSRYRGLEAMFFSPRLEVRGCRASRPRVRQQLIEA